MKKQPDSSFMTTIVGVGEKNSKVDSVVSSYLIHGYPCTHGTYRKYF